jgi:hypothetical protein
LVQSASRIVKIGEKWRKCAQKMVEKVEKRKRISLATEDGRGKL